MARSAERSKRIFTKGAVAGNAVCRCNPSREKAILENPQIFQKKHEHEAEGERFVKIAELTNNYEFPDDACGTYQVTYRMLEDFQNDLHKHIHLENNILFPKAIAMEKTF